MLGPERRLPVVRLNQAQRGRERTQTRSPNDAISWSFSNNRMWNRSFCDESRTAGCGPRARHAPGQATQAVAEPVEVEIDDWRGVERQHLRQHQAADNAVAERLTNLRAGAGTEH